MVGNLGFYAAISHCLHIVGMQNHVDSKCREGGIACKDAMIGCAKSLSSLTIAVCKQSAAFLVEIGGWCIVEVSSNNSQLSAILEIVNQQIPFLLVFDDCLAEFAVCAATRSAVDIAVLNVMHLFLVALVKSIGIEMKTEKTDGILIP